MVLTAMLGISVTAPAQSTLGPERRDIGNFGGDIWSAWTSPAGMRRRDLLSTAAALGAAALTSRIDSAGYVWMRTHERTFAMRLLAPTREGARFSPYEMGSGQYLLPFSGVLYVAGRLSHSVNLRDAGLGCAAGHLASMGLRQVAFRAVTRSRPTVTADPFDISIPGTSDWSKESFYSGHISNSMACASFLTHRYSLGLAEPIPYVYSVAIGLGRLADGHHWASDMFIGGVIGFAVGKAIAERQLHREAPPAEAGAPRPQRANWQIPVVQWSIVF
ncbi:MAG: phosphatase PAP2 family protein [Gemmatimonadota bacterium]